jgi:uncharacterized protein (DUF305 family)
MKFRIFRTTLPAVTLAAILATAGCSAAEHTSGMDHASPRSSSSSSVTGQFNDADVMFVQMMIPHHEQAIDMSDMILAKTGVHPEVIALAKQIKAAQQPEIDAMNSWLRTWGGPRTTDGGSHHGGGGGMMTEEEMHQLDAANGSEGQRLFLTGMIKHHVGAVDMAQTEIGSGKYPEAVALARNIAASQQREIDAMTKLLDEI